MIDLINEFKYMLGEDRIMCIENNIKYIKSIFNIDYDLLLIESQKELSEKFIKLTHKTVTNIENYIIKTHNIETKPDTKLYYFSYALKYLKFKFNTEDQFINRIYELHNWMEKRLLL